MCYVIVLSIVRATQSDKLLLRYHLDLSLVVDLATRSFYAKNNCEEAKIVSFRDFADIPAYSKMRDK